MLEPRLSVASRDIPLKTGVAIQAVRKCRDSLKRYLSDAVTLRIDKFTATGTQSAVAMTGNFKRLAGDSAGNLYARDWFHNVVMKMSPRRGSYHTRRK